MNTKKNKNKNRLNKPQNPSPPQKSENETKKPEPVPENVDILESALKSEERVPEIISEVVNVPASDVKEETGNDSPKKPKRNRGKKKKGEVEESDIVEKTPEVAFETKSSEVKEEAKLVESGNIAKDDEEDLPMAPAARKKKGKNKSTTQQAEKSTEDTVAKKEKNIESKDVASEHIETSEQETKASKKKNKKNKKRNDSEKSDKAEDLSCTSAFQKGMYKTDGDFKDQLVMDTKTEDVKESDSSFSEPTVKEVDKLSKNIASQKRKDEAQTKTAVVEPTENVDLPETAIVPEPSKNKKKNKKDIKHTEPPDLNIESVPPESLVGENIETLVSSDVTKEKSKSIIPPTLPVEKNITDIPTDPSQKLKPNIAKPVEKKSKGKSSHPDEKTQFENPTALEALETKLVSEPKQIDEIFNTPEVCSSPDCATPTEHTKSRKKKGKGKLIIAEVEIIPDLSDIPEDVTLKEIKELEIMAQTEAITPEKPPNIQDIKESAMAEIADTIYTKKQSDIISVPEIESRKKRKKSPKPSSKCEKDKAAIEKDPIETESTETEVSAQIKVAESITAPAKTTGNEAPKHCLTTVLEKDNIKMPEQDTKQPRDAFPKPSTKLEEKEDKYILKKDFTTPAPLIQTSQGTNYVCTPPESYSPKADLDTLKKSITESVKQIENISTLELEPRKQRKKSPKPPTTTEKPIVEETNIATIASEPTQMPTTGLDIGKDIIDKSKAVESMKIQEHESKKQRKKSPKPSTKTSAPVDDKKDIIETSPPTPRTEDMPKLIPIEMELDLPQNLEIIENTTAVPEKEPDSIKIPDPEQGKKRKKSPKPSKKPDQTAEKSIKLDTDIPVNEMADKTKLTEETYEPKPISLADILKLESKTTSTTTETKHPDLIEHPRSVSAGTIDNNNNTFIQEVLSSESNLTVPIVLPDTPFIRGTTVSPLISPDIISSEFRVSDIKTSTELSKDSAEKHDLKSKVMEVNQDMEDLRISIERSLAELTALEKKDEEFEKKYEVGQLTSGDIKKGDSKEIIQLQELEKDKKQGKDIIQTQAVKIEKDNPKGENLIIDPTKLVEPPVCPARKDNKGKSKSKNKGRNQTHQPHMVSSTEATSTTSKTENEDKTSQESKKEERTEQKDQTKSLNEQKGKQQSENPDNEDNITKNPVDTEKDTNMEFDPIENFEDAITSSVDDVNKTFEVIAKEATDDKDNPKINITEPDEEDEKGKEKPKNENPLSQPKNLLGHPDIPVPSNRTDYKKEKNKPPNTRQAKVKIKDSVDIDKNLKQSKESQTENRKLIKNKNANETVTCVTSENDEYVYKYSFRKVFLSSNCHNCKKDLKATRIPCSFCSLIFYCNQKHRDEDWPQHQGFCFAVSTIIHLKGLKHIYASAANITGQNYRLLRMQMIVSCEKVLKRKLTPCEQEMLLYPRICAESTCREWRQWNLQDCAGCGQISFCAVHPDHLPKSHARWCKSYCLYQKLVVYQLTQGRLEPKLPGRLMTAQRMSDNINRLLADMYEEKIEMSDMQYAALTQLATAPLTAAFCYQIYDDAMKTVMANGVHKKSTFTIHVVGAELQFEADSLNKWEVFFLHLKPDVQELSVVLVGPELNPSKLPLDLLGKIKLCATCRLDKRRVLFSFRDRQMFHEYCASDDFLKPDIVCAFNPSINRSSMYDNQNWTSTVNAVLKLKVPLVITSYTMNELQRDLSTIKTVAKEDFNIISEAKFNPFASVRPDRNFITDDEMPLLFKNYCYMVVIAACACF